MAHQWDVETINEVTNFETIPQGLRARIVGETYALEVAACLGRDT